MVNDPIADLLTRMRNGYMAHRSEVTCEHSELKYAILKILEKKGYIEGVELAKDEGDKKVINIQLKAIDRHQIAPSFKRMSTPGRRYYVKASQIKPVNSGHGLGIISTSKGIMTSYEAVSGGLGGEYLCQVY